MNLAEQPAPGVTYANYFFWYPTDKFKDHDGATAPIDFDLDIVADADLLAYTPKKKFLGATYTASVLLTTALTLASAFVDTLPTNLILGTPATNTGTCPNGSIIAVAGGTSITFKNGATLPAAGGCTIIVPVTSATAGIYTNNILAGALVTTIGSNPSPASATLSILQADLSITKTDGVASVVPGTSTTYTSSRRMPARATSPTQP